MRNCWEMIIQTQPMLVGPLRYQRWVECFSAWYYQSRVLKHAISIIQLVITNVQEPNFNSVQKAEIQTYSTWKLRLNASDPGFCGSRKYTETLPRSYASGIWIAQGQADYSWAMRSTTVRRSSCEPLLVDSYPIQLWKCGVWWWADGEIVIQISHYERSEIIWGWLH